VDVVLVRIPAAVYSARSVNWLLGHVADEGVDLFAILVSQVSISLIMLLYFAETSRVLLIA
jgi:hypothetical protein